MTVCAQQRGGSGHTARNSEPGHQHPLQAWLKDRKSKAMDAAVTRQVTTTLGSYSNIGKADKSEDRGETRNMLTPWAGFDVGGRPGDTAFLRLGDQ